MHAGWRYCDVNFGPPAKMVWLDQIWLVNLVRGVEISSNFGSCQQFRSYAHSKTAYTCKMPREDSGSVGDTTNKAYIYLTEGSYPCDATSNEKRAIRR